MPTIINHKGLSVMDPDPSPLAEGGYLINTNFKILGDRTTGTAGRIPFFDSITNNPPTTSPNLTFNKTTNVLSFHRALALGNVADVTSPEFGSTTFDGTTDNSTQVNAAITALKAVNGPGILLFPPHKLYIAANIDIAHKYPIHIRSQMDKNGFFGASNATFAQSGFIRPPVGGCDYIFRFSRHTDLVPVGTGAGGSVSGISFVDIDHPNVNTRERLITTAALWIDDATHFELQNTDFRFLLGTALKVDETTYTYISGGCHFNNCGIYAAVIAGVINNGSGLIRIQSYTHGYQTGDSVTISNVQGVTAANGTWTITKINSNDFDLQGSAFSGTYTAGTGYAKNNSRHKPVIDVGGQATQAYLWGERRTFLENNNATGIKIRTNGAVRWESGYHENASGSISPTNCIHVDGTDGQFISNNTDFLNTTETAFILGFTNSRVSGGNISCYSGANHTIIIKPAATHTILENIVMSLGVPVGTAKTIFNEAAFCHFRGLKINGGGPINTYISGKATDFYWYTPYVANGDYALVGESGGMLLGCLIDGRFSGGGPGTGHGILASGTSTIGCTVRDLNGGNGFTAFSATDQFIGCRALALNGGQPFAHPYYPGMIRAGNYADVGDAHSPRRTSRLNLGLSMFRKYVDGTSLTGATTPQLTKDAVNNEMMLIWVAANSDSIYLQTDIPEEFDGTQDMNITVSVKTDNAGGGGIDPATMVAVATFDSGSAESMTLTDSSPSTSLHDITATLLAANIPDNPKRLTLLLSPQTHANDPIRLHNVSMSYTEIITTR